MTHTPQDLLFTQLISAATLAWLKRHNLPSMQVFFGITQDGSLDLQFGLPQQVDADRQEALIRDWIDYSKQLERLHVLLLLLQEGHKLNTAESQMNAWREEGEQLKRTLLP
jgi:hypothetical protein